ncbi:MAG: DUF4389 domain-containing protein [Methanophagales archaeon]|nr:DUF4389 domain-containing protein [Methanophagales archaeon]MCW3140970.1 DUF4389 domain-containing protein [Methanophagales archaeon]
MVEEKPGELKQLFVYEHDASRLELFIRIVYGWVCIGIVVAVYGFIAEICMLIQWFVILILGRRSEGLSNFIKGYLEYLVHVMSYYYFMTDDRPGILPKRVEIYEKE